MKSTPRIPGELPFAWAKRVLDKYDHCIYCGRSKRRHDPACHALPKVSPDAPQKREASRPRRERALSAPAPRHINAVKRGECEWCGQPARGGACSEHDDLAHSDPRYNPEAALRRKR